MSLRENLGCAHGILNKTQQLKQTAVGTPAGSYLCTGEHRSGVALEKKGKEKGQKGREERKEMRRKESGRKERKEGEERGKREGIEGRRKGGE